jgi:hypothetical protein
LLDRVPLDGGDATQGNDLFANQLGVAERFLGTVEEHARINFSPEAGDEKARLRVLGHSRPLVTQALVQLFNQLGFIHGNVLVLVGDGRVWRGKRGYFCNGNEYRRQGQRQLTLFQVCS